MKKAFTLIELIFVIVIIGIMAGVGFSAFKPTYLLDDTNFVAGKIKEAQFLGIGYEHLNFDGSQIDDKTGCITIEKNSLEENATNKNQVNYKLHVSIEADDNNQGTNNTICFDSKGRPHHTDFTLANLLTTQSKFQFTYSGKNRTITIEPITGYMIISY